MTLPTEQPEWRWHLAAFALYVLLSVAFLDHGVSLIKNILGPGSDPYGFIWFLAWWPWAISHHLNPLITHLVWQPSGLNILWASSVPFLALLALPVTLSGGPVLAFNLLVLLAPVLAAWCAYRLCWRLTKQVSVSLIGGYIFGFSSYQMAQAATLNLSFTFLAPCLVWLALVRLDGEISRLKTVILLGLLMIFQFLISTEIFAMLVVFGSMAWLLAFTILPPQRQNLARLAVDALIAAPIIAITILPFLISMFSHYPFIHLPALWPYFFVADFLSFVVPTQITYFGGAFTHDAVNNFFKDIQEQNSYLGLPLLVLIYLYAKEQWRNPYGKYLIMIFLLVLTASLGPHLWFAGAYTKLVLPWRIFMALPLLGGALPVRFALYTALAAAIITTLFLTAPRLAPWRFGLGLLACIAIIPASHVTETIPSSVFFKPGGVQAVLGPNARLLILPFAINGASSYWQVENQFGFLQTGGYLGFPPAAMQIYPAVQELFSNNVNNVNLQDFENFCFAMKTQYIVAGPGTTPAFLAMLAQLHWPMQKIDDVMIFTVPATNNQEIIHG